MPPAFRRAIVQALVLAVLAVAPALAAALWHPRWKDSLNDLSPAEAVRLQPLWIDARSAKEYASGHVPGALLLNEDDWHQSLPAVLMAWQPDQPAVVYCSSRSCQTSRSVAARLRDFAMGRRIHVLRGGWEAWQAQQTQPSK